MTGYAGYGNSPLAPGMVERRDGWTVFETPACGHRPCTLRAVDGCTILDAGPTVPRALPPTALWWEVEVGHLWALRIAIPTQDILDAEAEARIITEGPQGVVPRHAFSRMGDAAEAKAWEDFNNAERLA